MALQHASSGQAVALLRDGEDLSQFSSIALAKTAQLELIRIVLPQGKTMPEHKVPGDITVQCLHGAIAFQAHGKEVLLEQGAVLYLDGGIWHALRAERDSVILLTIRLVG